MKKKSLYVYIFTFPTLLLCFQLSYAQKNAVFSTKEFIFYGYDYSHFKISDPKRVGQNIKNYIFVWIDFCNDVVNEKNLAKWFEKSKVIVNQNPTIEINMKLNNDNLASISPILLPKDSIQDYVNRYNVKEKNGIGFVIIFECFDKKTKTVSAYYTFFDVATKKVFLSDYFISRDGNGYNYVRDWANAVIIALKKYVKVYHERL